MNDLEILDKITEELKTVDHPRFADNMIDFYEKLVERVPEDGFEQILDDVDLSLEQETAILQLQKYGYLERTMLGIGRGRIEHKIDLRGKRFFELANQHAAGPQKVLPHRCQNPLPLGAGTGEQKQEFHPGGNKANEMQDSGQRETFSTGAVRDTAEGKPRPDLFSPFAMERIGKWLEQGARKYEPRNWEKGMGYERVASSLHRHLMKYMQHDTSEDHLAAIAVNASFLMHYDAMIERGVLPKELNDLPKYDPMPSCHRNGDEILEHEPDEEFSWRKVHENG